MNWLILLCAIALEVIGTSALKASEGFTRLIPTAITIGSYIGAFYFLSLVLRTIPMGIAYALWSGVGIVAISIIGLIVYRQQLDLAAYIGIGLILAGTCVINLFSKATAG